MSSDPEYRMSGEKVSRKHIVFTSVSAGDDRVDLEAVRVSREPVPMHIEVPNAQPYDRLRQGGIV